MSSSVGTEKFKFDARERFCTTLCCQIIPLKAGIQFFFNHCTNCDSPGFLLVLAFQSPGFLMVLAFSDVSCWSLLLVFLVPRFSKSWLFKVLAFQSPRFSKSWLFKVLAFQKMSKSSFFIGPGFSKCPRFSWSSLFVVLAFQEMSKSSLFIGPRFSKCPRFSRSSLFVVLAFQEMLKSSLFIGPRFSKCPRFSRSSLFNGPRFLPVLVIQSVLAFQNCPRFVFEDQLLVLCPHIILNGICTFLRKNGEITVLTDSIKDKELKITAQQASLKR